MRWRAKRYKRIEGGEKYLLAVLLVFVEVVVMILLFMLVVVVKSGRDSAVWL